MSKVTVVETGQKLTVTEPTDKVVHTQPSPADIVKVAGQGPQGIQGPASTVPGPASTVPGPAGKSAYQVAVDQGYSGTVNDWLLTLKGATGSTPTKSNVTKRVAPNVSPFVRDNLSATASTAVGPATWLVPNDYVSGTDITLRWWFRHAATGNVVLSRALYRMKPDGTAFDTILATQNVTVSVTTVNQETLLDSTYPAASVVAGTLIYSSCLRVGANAADVNTGASNIDAVEMIYTGLDYPSS